MGPGRRLLALSAVLGAATSFVASGGDGTAALRVAVRLPAAPADTAFDGRLLLLLSDDPSAEPRFQLHDTSAVRSQQVFGIDVLGLRAGQEVLFDASVAGYPAERLADVRPGTYRIQAFLFPHPTETRYVRHVRIQSERLTRFWGRPTYLGAHVLLPTVSTSTPRPGIRSP